jgi:hypothetical protein
MKKDKFKLKGIWTIERRKKDGTVIDSETIKNVIVADGLERVARLIGGISTTPFSHIAVGTDDTAALVTDTELNVEVSRSEANTSYEADYKAIFDKIISFGEEFTLNEAGLFDSGTASGSTMLNRVVFADKVVSDVIDLYIKITITVS